MSDKDLSLTSIRLRIAHIGAGHHWNNSDFEAPIIELVVKSGVPFAAYDEYVEMAHVVLEQQTLENLVQCQYLLKKISRYAEKDGYGKEAGYDDPVSLARQERSEGARPHRPEARHNIALSVITPKN